MKTRSQRQPSPTTPTPKETTSTISPLGLVDGKPINQYDLEATRKEYMFKPPSFITSYFENIIQDKRDTLMIYLSFNITVTIFPFAAALYWLREVPTWLGIAYLLFLYFNYIQRFTLMLHYSEHRKLFPEEYVFWNSFIPYVLCPFFGIPSGLYFAHHVVMHHQENNMMDWDMSSTESYQRDNFSSFIHYWFRWIICIWVQLPYYLYRRNNWKFLTPLMTMMISWYAAVFILYRLSSDATFWVFVMPVFCTQFLFAFGNYSQHMFVDPDRPRDNYALTYQCINVKDNQYSFNDGYHITHHLNARLHWSLMPQRFLDNIEKYVANDAIIFNKISFFEVGILAFAGQWKLLSSYVLQLGPKKRTEQELIDMFKHRCKPIKFVEKNNNGNSSPVVFATSVAEASGDDE